MATLDVVVAAAKQGWRQAALAALGLTACAVVVRLRSKVTDLERQLDKSVKSRRMERAGRIRAEKLLRELFQPLEQRSRVQGHVFPSIGTVESVFRRRFGCPRQGSVAPLSRGLIRFEPGVQACSSLSGLETFSHVWLIFVFSENTNHVSTFKGKIRPPRLGGRKVGVLATRTPHRPNAIGMSLVRVERIDKSGVLHVSGLDLVDGTPILDVKPYVPGYDDASDAVAPQWILGSDATREPLSGVEWSSHAIAQLDGLAKKLRFYPDASEFRAFVDQVLRLDIRSNLKLGADFEHEMHQVELDNLAVQFRVARAARVAHVVGVVKRPNRDATLESEGDLARSSLSFSESSHVLSGVRDSLHSSNRDSIRSVATTDAATSDDDA